MKPREKIYKITCIILLLDQIIKLIINNKMQLYDQIEIIPNFFSIFYVKNTGAAFSLFENNTTILIIVSVIFIIILDNLIKKEKKLNKQAIFSLGLIMGGMFGNLIDRILHHGVIDYISFSFRDYDFPIFNLADIGITIGVIILIINILLENKKKKL